MAPFQKTTLWQQENFDLSLYFVFPRQTFTFIRIQLEWDSGNIQVKDGNIWNRKFTNFDVGLTNSNERIFIY